MRTDPLARWRLDLVGEWVSRLAGPDPLLLELSAPHFEMRLRLYPDGTAAYHLTIPDPSGCPPDPEPPFPETWELSDERVLSVWLPIAPMPEYEMPDWTREQKCFDVLLVTDLSLTLSNRRFDGEDVIVLRRVSRAEDDRRGAAEYGLLPG